MDLLTSILQDAGLRRRVLGRRHLRSDQAMGFPCNRSIGLHVALQGPVHVHARELPAPLRLEAGDIAFMARGSDHELSPAATITGLPRVSAWAADAGPVPDDAAVEQAPVAQALVLSGAFQLWHAPVHPFFAELPAWTVLRAQHRPQLGSLSLAIGLMSSELAGDDPGADSVVQALLDVVFTYVLRELAAQRGQAGSGWSHAARDAAVGRSLALMHEALDHPWTLDELAQRAGLSRTALAERFRDAMGQTPLNHLRTLRMQRAMRLLADPALTLEAVAAQVGYQDAFSFSKAFKRTVAVSPREFRQREAREREHPHRFAQPFVGTPAA